MLWHLSKPTSSKPKLLTLRRDGGSSENNAGDRACRRRRVLRSLRAYGTAEFHANFAPSEEGNSTLLDFPEHDVHLPSEAAAIDRMIEIQLAVENSATHCKTHELNKEDDEWYLNDFSPEQLDTPRPFGH